MVKSGDDVSFKNVVKGALFEKIFGVSVLIRYFCRIICDDMRYKSLHK